VLGDDASLPPLTNTQRRALRDNLHLELQRCEGTQGLEPVIKRLRDRLQFVDRAIEMNETQGAPMDPDDEWIMLDDTRGSARALAASTPVRDSPSADRTSSPMITLPPTPAVVVSATESEPAASSAGQSPPRPKRLLPKTPGSAAVSPGGKNKRERRIKRILYKGESRRAGYLQRFFASSSSFFF
jgi:hypothetical protein